MAFVSRDLSRFEIQCTSHVDYFDDAFIFCLWSLIALVPVHFHGVEKNRIDILLNTGTAGSQREDDKNNITVVCSHWYICLISGRKSSSQRPTAVTF